MTKIKFPQKAADNRDHTREHMRIFCLEFNSSILLHQHTTETLFESTTRCAEKPDIHESKGKIRAHRASSKATILILRSHKSNINQSSLTHFHIPRRASHQRPCWNTSVARRKHEEVALHTLFQAWLAWPSGFRQTKCRNFTRAYN